MSLSQRLRKDPAALRAMRDLVGGRSWQSFYAFAQLMFAEVKGFRWVHNWHHAEIARAMFRVFSGESTRLIVMMPPRYGKTELIIKMFAAWAMGVEPDSEFIHASYAASLAGDNSGAIRATVSSDLYRLLFPATCIDPAAGAARDHWKTTRGGVFFSTGVGGPCTGFGAGKQRQGFGGAILIDDPHKASEATASDKKRASVISWFQNTLESRKNRPETPIVVVMQRLHEADLAGFLEEGGNGEEWEVLRLEAIQNEGTDREEALWPAKHSLAKLKAMQRAAPLVFAGQYQQRPTPAEGDIFRPDMLAVVKAPEPGTRFFRGWDFAATEGGGDWTAGGLIGIQPSGRFIIAGMERGQLGPHKVEKLVIDTAAADGVFTGIFIPQDPGQAGKSQALSFVQKLGRYNVTPRLISGDKVVLATPFAAQVNAGNVDMLEGPWNAALTAEMRAFPNGKHDDQIDALSIAYNGALESETGILDMYREAAEERRAMVEASRAQGEKGAKPEPAPAGPEAFFT